MRFCIGKTAYFSDLGYDTTHWRKSKDGRQALVHADTVAGDELNEAVSVYNHNSPALMKLLKSQSWTSEEG